MAASTTAAQPMPTAAKPKKRSHLRSDILVNGVLLLIVIAWLVPVVSLVISSFRTRFDIQTSGWWTIAPHRAWETVTTIPVPEGVDRKASCRSRAPRAPSSSSETAYRWATPA